MRDIATHLGISHATVSRALRSDPRITESVRQKVTRTADKLGYKRDPVLSQLMAHLRTSKQRTFQGTLAWITDHDVTQPAERTPHLLYWESAERRAAELGYKLECFPNCRPNDAPRLEKRLRAQGIQGIVIQQFKAAFHLPDWKMNWKKLAIIHNGSAQMELCLDSVDADDIGNCVQVFTRLSQIGHRRIGICTTQAIEQATSYSLSTAQQRFALLQPDTLVIPACLLPDLSSHSAAIAARWLKKHRVEAVISQVRGMRELLESIGHRVPEDLSLAYQGVNPHGPNSGIWQREDIIATVIIESLIASVEQGRHGLPATPRITLIQGVWHPGTTCRQKETATTQSAG